MQSFFTTWHTSSITSLGLFWTAFWAFGLGYCISGMIQVFVTRERMKAAMGETGARSVGLGTFFGFISSSCSFAALATTRSLFTKGAGLIPSLAFLLASTNLVIELGIVIAVFLGWQFVVGEYAGGILLILLMWLIVRLTKRDALVEEARKHARREEDGEKEHEHGSEESNWKKLIRSSEGWRRVAMKYVMEWRMVWKDVLIGFTVAGIIAAFVPKEFFQALFPGSGTQEPGFIAILLQAFIGPLAAFFTFIGSMGNIPLAAVLFSNGVSFAGIMAFIFSDLVVFPVLRIQARYYGWKMAFYILAVFLSVLIASSILMHYAFAAAGALPEGASAQRVTERDFFNLDYTFFLNLFFAALSSLFLFLHLRAKSDHASESGRTFSEKVLSLFSAAAVLWLAGGLVAGLAG